MNSVHFLTTHALFAGANKTGGPKVQPKTAEPTSESVTTPQNAPTPSPTNNDKTLEIPQGTQNVVFTVTQTHAATKGNDVGPKSEFAKLPPAVDSCANNASGDTPKPPQVVEEYANNVSGHVTYASYPGEAVKACESEVSPEQRKQDLIRQICQSVRRYSSIANPRERALKPFGDFKALRPQQIDQLLAVTRQHWLRHALVTSDSPELTEGVLLGLYEQLPQNTKVIQLKELGLLVSQISSLFLVNDCMIPSPESPKKQKTENVKVQEELARKIYEVLRKKYQIQDNTPIVLVVKDIIIGNPSDTVLQDLWNAIEKINPNIHIIATGRFEQERASREEGLMESMMPAFMRKTIEAMKDLSGKRFDNIKCINIPRIKTEEWPGILSKTSNPIGEAAKKILNNHHFQFFPDALAQFIGAISVQYNERPSKQDILAELDQFGSFFNKTKTGNQKTATLEDVHRFVKTELAKRANAEEINPFEEIGSMMVPNPFSEIKYSGVTFKDVIGHEEAKTAIMDVLDPYNRALFEASNGSSHSNVTTIMLVGPPGTGKTELAKAAAGEFNGTMIEANAAQLMNQYQASGSVNTSRLKKMIQSASSDVVVIFLDEIDAVGSRDSGMMSSEERRTLNSLLTMLQGAGKQFNKTVVFMFATNKPEALDEALLSRVERRIQVNPPNHEDRQNIWKLHLAKANIIPDASVDWAKLADLTNKFVGRDIFFMVKGIKKALVRNMPDEQKRAIVSNPELLKAFRTNASQAELENGIELFKQESQMTKQNNGIGFTAKWGAKAKK